MSRNPGTDVSTARCCQLEVRTGFCLEEAPRPSQCEIAGWVGDYVLNKPCDCRHVSGRDTRCTPSHEAHVLDGAFNCFPSPRPPLRRAHTRARSSLLLLLLAVRAQPIGVVVVGWGCVPCCTMLLRAPCLRRRRK